MGISCIAHLSQLEIGWLWSSALSAMGPEAGEGSYWLSLDQVITSGLRARTHLETRGSYGSHVVQRAGALAGRSRAQILEKGYSGIDKTVNINLIMSIYLESCFYVCHFLSLFLGQKSQMSCSVHNWLPGSPSHNFTSSHTASLLVFFLLVFPFPVSPASSFFFVGAWTDLCVLS